MVWARRKAAAGPVIMYDKGALMRNRQIDWRRSVRARGAGVLGLVLAALGAPAAAQEPSGPPWLRGLAAERGVSLPRPYGLGLAYSDGSQDLVLENFLLSVDGGPREGVDFISLNDSELETRGPMLKGDVWVFPFLNLFGFVGEVDNDVSSDFSIPGDELVAYAGSAACDDPADPERPAICDRTITGTVDRSSEALNYGGGALLAVGRGRYFALLSLIYATSNAQDSDTDVQQFSAAPRLGRRWPLPNGGEIAGYAGAMFVDSEVVFHNSTVVPTAGQAGLAEDITVDYSVTQANEDDWAYLLGANWDISRDWSLQAEYSIGAREGLLATLVRRFGD